MPPATNGAVRRRPNATMLQQQSSNLQSKPWFLGAPMSKILCIIWAAGSLWIIRSNNVDPDDYASSDYRKYGHYDTSIGAAIWNGPSSWFFESTSELIVGLSFLAHFLRRMEQELSTRRLIAWLLILQVACIFSRLVAVATLDEDTVSAFMAPASAKGPYLVVGGVLYWYKACVPRLYPRFLSSTMFGISLSEKSFPYGWALYILFMRGIASIIVGAIGGFACAIYLFLLNAVTKNTGSTINIPFLDIPDAVVNLLPWESLGSLFLLDANPKVYAPFISRATMIPTGDGRARRPRRRVASTSQRVQPVAETPVAVAVPVPSPEAIAQLTSMGFEEQRVKEALQVSDNNVERAANILLTGS